MGDNYCDAVDQRGTSQNSQKRPQLEASNNRVRRTCTKGRAGMGKLAADSGRFFSRPVSLPCVPRLKKLPESSLNPMKTLKGRGGIFCSLPKFHFRKGILELERPWIKRLLNLRFLTVFSLTVSVFRISSSELFILFLHVINPSAGAINKREMRG